VHQGNRDWLKSVREKYPEHFKDAQVLEIGSYNVNGTARDYFKDAKRYVGVDCCKGKCVDIVCKATETKFKPGEFDTLVYLSVFEHDPIWRAGFEHNLPWVRTGGLILICFGAEGNLPHPPEPWAIVPVKAWEKAAKEMPLEILDAFFEKDRKGITYDTPGAYDVLARKIATLNPL